ncbi:MAG: TlpA family protein disulfide reductase [Thiotrichales bacterium]|nr:TlpA family protein disulfide reductase [Thiotrichales bacterium]
MQNIGSKLFGGLVVLLLGALLYVTVFSDGLGKGPEIKITNTQGQEFVLSKPQKPVLVNFWATTCPGCIEKMPALAKMKQELGDRFELVAVSMEYDPQAQVQKFIQANPYPFVFVMDQQGKIAEGFGEVLLTPTTFLVAPNGKIVYKKIGEMDFNQVSDLIQKMSPQFQ